MHEHPASASSWKLPEVTKMMNRPGVECIVNSTCMFGMTTKDEEGNEGPVLKPTRWMTNAPCVAQQLNRRCKGTHEHHVRLMGSNRAARAAVYPPKLVKAIVKGLQAQREFDHRAGRAECPLSAAIIQAMMDEDEIKALQWARAVMDEYTGEALDADFVAKGKKEELDFFKSKAVWRVVPRTRTQGQRVVGTRWVNCNKGDDTSPDVRCRLVAQEVKTDASDDFFAPTPLTESMKLIVSMAAESQRRQVTLVDIS